MYQTQQPDLREIAIQAGLIPGRPCYHSGLNNYFAELRKHPCLTRHPNKWFSLEEKCFLLAEHWVQEGQFYVFLKTLITHPDYRKQGYATKMLNIVKDTAIKSGFKNEIILVPAAWDWTTHPDRSDWKKPISAAQVQEGTSPCPSAPLCDEQLTEFYLRSGWRKNIVTEIFAINTSAFGYRRVEQSSMSDYGKTQKRQFLAWRKDFREE